ncbi:MAG: hypothetical protein KAT30_08855, partial [Candidatus Krumholzibacteria bacterium]|nr:hypothetical protein [Candidatus Krumholzibacteria bacterium]
QALRKLTGTVAKTKTCLIFTNQIRMKIGVMFGSPETTSGGNALKFYSTVRMDIRRIGAIKEGDTISGNRTKVKVIKNKVAPPFKVAEFDIIYGEGISYEGDVIDIGVAIEAVKKSGTWYSFEEERLGQGKEASRRFLKEHPDITERIASRIRSHHGLDQRGEDASDRTKSGENKSAITDERSGGAEGENTAGIVRPVSPSPGGGRRNARVRPE